MQPSHGPFVFITELSEDNFEAWYERGMGQQRVGHDGTRCDGGSMSDELPPRSGSDFRLQGGQGGVHQIHQELDQKSGKRIDSLPNRRDGRLHRPRSSSSTIRSSTSFSSNAFAGNAQPQGRPPLAPTAIKPITINRDTWFQGQPDFGELKSPVMCECGGQWDHPQHLQSQSVDGYINTLMHEHML
jgi:hypothetical protein